MRQSGRTTLFVLVCIAVLTAAYGVGLGVRKLRSDGFKLQITWGGETEKSADEPDPDAKPETGKVVAAAEPPHQEEPTEKPDEEPSEEPPEEVATRPERPDITTMKERFQAMSEEERQEVMAQKRQKVSGRIRGEGRGRGGAYQQLSEEDRNALRTKMEALGAQAGEMSEEDMRQARSKIFEEYGITPPAQGGGGRRPGGRQ